MAIFVNFLTFLRVFRPFLKIGSNDFFHTPLICGPTYATCAGIRKLPGKVHKNLKFGVKDVQFGHFPPKWPKYAHF